MIWCAKAMYLKRWNKTHMMNTVGIAILWTQFKKCRAFRRKQDDGKVVMTIIDVQNAEKKIMSQEVFVTNSVGNTVRIAVQEWKEKQNERRRL